MRLVTYRDHTGKERSVTVDTSRVEFSVWLRSWEQSGTPIIVLYTADVSDKRTTTEGNKNG